MSPKTRKSFFIFTILLFVIGGCYTPLHAQATNNEMGTVGGDVSDPDSDIGISIWNPATLILSPLQAAGGWVVNIAQGFLNACAGDELIPYSKTRMDNPVVAAGWPLVRNLANILIFLGILYAGLATALDIGGFTLKQALIKLIAVALLVNFTPVIVGLIVDAGDIATNYFIGTGTSGTAILADHFRGAFSEFNGAEDIIPAIVYFGAALTAAFIIFIFGLLYLLRHLVIWLLVIVSPLVFVAWALPIQKMKSYAKQWWDQLFGWVFLGVPAGFVLFLTATIMDNLVVPSGPDTSIFNEMIVLFIPILFMIIGLMASLEVTMFGSKMIKGGLKLAKQGAISGAKAGATKIGKTGREWVGKGAAKMAQKEGETTEQARQRISGQWTSKKGAFGWAVRGAGKLVGSSKKQREEDYKQHQEKMKDMDTYERNAYYRRIGSNSISRAARLDLAREDENEDFSKVASNLIKDEKDLEKAYGSSIKTGKEELRKSLERIFAKDYGSSMQEISEAAGVQENSTAQLQADGYANLTEKTFLEAKTEKEFKELAHWAKEDLASPSGDITEATLGKTHQKWNSGQLSTAAKELGKNFAEEFTRSYHDIAARTNMKPDSPELYAEVGNPSLAYYRSSSAAKKSGLGAPWSDKDVDEAIQ